MNKEDKKFTEDKIKEYFDIEKRIQLTKNLIISLKDKKSMIENETRKLKLNFNIEIKSNTIDGMPRCNGDGTSYFESNIMKQIEFNENMIKNIEENIINQEKEITMLDFKNTSMKNIMNILSKEQRLIVDLRYNKQESGTYITEQLHLSSSQYHLTKKKILIIIYNSLFMCNEINN